MADSVPYLRPDNNQLVDVATNDLLATKLDALTTKVDALTSTATPSPVYGIGQEPLPFSAGGTTILQETTGAIGDRLDILTLTPTTTSVGTLVIKDGTNTKLTIAAQTLPTLLPFSLVLNWASKAGAWSIVAGAGWSGAATGNFT